MGRQAHMTRLALVSITCSIYMRSSPWSPVFISPRKVLRPWVVKEVYYRPSFSICIVSIHHYVPQMCLIKLGTLSTFTDYISIGSVCVSRSSGNIDCFSRGRAEDQRFGIWKRPSLGVHSHGALPKLSATLRHQGPSYQSGVGRESSSITKGSE